MKFKLNKATEFTIHGWFRQIDTHELNIPYAIKHLLELLELMINFIHLFFGQYTIDQNSTRVSTHKSIQLVIVSSMVKLK